MEKYNSFEEYIKPQSQRGREMLIELRSLILEAAPNVIESMGYGSPAFDLIPNAKLNDKIMLGGFKNHVSFYPHKDTIKVFKEELIPYKVLESTIQFSYKKDIPKDLVKRMVIHRFNKVNQK
ncbi:hypothetical protein KQ51_00890 [Candidatus Izimaplasma bacterium HR1]|jgi:uncharacterized protein YdhG (YjbR/CyaY superfamily)|uniref:iron chaperone n=1 Tax=Candidatus Izimoplasma sp. HR1 TaxID=1541959 RepID=UPI0004F6ECF9|nr:hypothetical protein KQ51_00890 [Candidatus Izimaplasma bacterium HR1]